MTRPSVSTTQGDSGDTMLFGGEKVSKASYRIHAYGTVDELNAILGLIIAEPEVTDTLRTQLTEVQHDLFVLGADLATRDGSEQGRTVRITTEDINRLEQWGTAVESELQPLTQFILPSGCRAAALLHQARTVCRRAERWIVHVQEHEPINGEALVYMNRLSDYFFLLSRVINKYANVTEATWKARD